ncbi:unnamed protein product [Sphagnum balticum]
MDRKTREELNDLSKRVFGSTSRWQKLVNNGVTEPLERDREVMLPVENGRIVRKVFTDRKHVNRRYSVGEVRKLMEDILAKNGPAFTTNVQTVTVDPNSVFTSGTPVSGEGIPEGSTVK